MVDRLVNFAGVVGVIVAALVLADRAFAPAPQPIQAAKPSGIVLKDDTARVM